MRKQYPKAAPAMTELEVGGARAVDDLASAGEVDSFHFDIASAATYIMTTEGSTDTVLTLHAPNDPGAVLALDDDRGRGLNARIVCKLGPGSYWLTVRRKLHTSAGSYTVGVKKRA